MREKPVDERVMRTLASVGTTAPLCLRFEAVWKAGGVPHIEDYLGLAPNGTYFGFSSGGSRLGFRFLNCADLGRRL
jgi:hypothetical protein